MRVALPFLISFVLLAAAYALSQAFQWSDRWAGFQSGLFGATTIGAAFWYMFLLPWGLLVVSIYRWRKWKKFQGLLICVPSILLGISMLGTIFTNPLTPENRFQRFTGTAFPSNATDLECSFSGGGFTDYFDAYFFNTTPEDTERLLKEMKFELHQDQRYKESWHVPENLKGVPAFSSWDWPVRFKRRENPDSNWFAYLTTNKSKTWVLLEIGCF